MTPKKNQKYPKRGVFEEAEKTSKEHEAAVRGYFESLHLKVTKLDSKSSTEKTPDFLVEAPDGFCFYCEVKSAVSDITEGILHKTKFNKLERRIIEAYAQFSRINRSHLAPNVLFFSSNDFRINYKSLEELFRGYVDVFTGKVDTTRYRDGNAYEAIRNIDLFVWYVDPLHKWFFFSARDQRFLTSLQRILEASPISEWITIAP